MTRMAFVFCFCVVLFFWCPQVLSTRPGMAPPPWLLRTLLGPKQAWKLGRGAAERFVCGGGRWVVPAIAYFPFPRIHGSRCVHVSDRTVAGLGGGDVSGLLQILVDTGSLGLATRLASSLFPVRVESTDVPPCAGVGPIAASCRHTYRPPVHVRVCPQPVPTASGRPDVSECGIPSSGEWIPYQAIDRLLLAVHAAPASHHDAPELKGAFWLLGSGCCLFSFLFWAVGVPVQPAHLPARCDWTV